MGKSKVYNGRLNKLIEKDSVKFDLISIKSEGPD